MQIRTIVVMLCMFCLIGISAATVMADDATEQMSNDENLTEQVNVFYLTLRNKTAGTFFDLYYGGQRDQLRAGVCSMEFSPIWGLKDIAESAPFYIPDENKNVKGVSEWPLTRFWEKVDAFDIEGEGNIVLYIHGYNIGFEKGCRNAATLQRSLDLHDRMIFFSWPADGNFLKYTYDEADLVWSVPYLKKVLDGIVARVGHKHLDVVAHSLGARGAVQALARMACKDPTTPILNELVLIAPDIDTQIFRHDLPALLNITHRITLYVSENDKALALSQEVHGYPRLGQAGEYLTVLEGIETIDISLVGTRRISGHVYHLANPAVIKDLALLLGPGKPAGSRPGLRVTAHDDITYWLMEPPKE